MAKKKNPKKKQNKKHNGDHAYRNNNKNVNVPEDEEDDDCGESIRSDEATLPSSDETIAAAGNNDVDLSLDGVNLRDEDDVYDPAKYVRRRRVQWDELRNWWDGECAPFTRILNDLIYDMNRTGSEGFMTAYEILQLEDESSHMSLLEEMTSTALAHSAYPAPDPIPRKAYYPEVKKYTKSELVDLIDKWSVMQSSYLPSGKFGDLETSRWHGTPDSNSQKYSPVHPPIYAPKVEKEERKPQDTSNVAPSQSKPDPDHIRVNLYSADGLTTVVSLKTTTRMAKLKEKHSSRLGRPLRGLIYRYKGKNLRDNDTVKALGMIENDIIHVLDAVQRRH